MTCTSLHSIYAEQSCQGTRRLADSSCIAPLYTERPQELRDAQPAADPCCFLTTVAMQMQLTGCKRQLDDYEQYQENTFLGSLPAPPISLNDVAFLTHTAPQPVSHSPAEPATAPAPAPAPATPQVQRPLPSPLDTAEVLHQHVLLKPHRMLFHVMPCTASSQSLNRMGKTD